MSNKNMNPIFSLKNFRSFGEDGADFELAPITVLTGCNSAGKSSLVKALLLQSSQLNKPSFVWLSSNPSAVDYYGNTLNIASKELNLGNYDKIINKHKNGDIILSYTIWSEYLQDKVVVKRTFVPILNDPISNGKLKVMTIEKLDGTVILKQFISRADNGITTPYEVCYFDSIKDDFEKFSSTFLYKVLLSVYNFYNTHTREKNITKKLLTKIDKRLDVINKEYGVNITRDNLVESLDKEKQNLLSKGIEVNEHLISKINTWFEYKNGGKQNPLFDNENTKYLQDLSKEDFLNNYQEYYVKSIAREVNSPEFIKDIKYVNSSSATIKRWYSVEDDDKLSLSLKNFYERLTADESADPYYHYNKVGAFLNKWIQNFGIGDNIMIQGVDEGLGIYVYLIKGSEKTLLADEGYGITQLFSLLLQIDNLIPTYVAPDDNCFDNGYSYNYKPKNICVEEPEIHLHPKYQSMLADMFVEAYQKYNIHFIIETHSEYLIRKLQVLVAEKKLKAEDVSLNYVEKNEEGVSHNRQIKIEEDGDLSESFGTGFYDEADKLAIKLFQNKPILS